VINLWNAFSWKFSAPLSAKRYVRSNNEFEVKNGMHFPYHRAKHGGAWMLHEVGWVKKFDFSLFVHYSFE